MSQIISSKSKLTFLFLSDLRWHLWKKKKKRIVLSFTESPVVQLTDSMQVLLLWWHDRYKALHEIPSPTAREMGPWLQDVLGYKQNFGVWFGSLMLCELLQDIWSSRYCTEPTADLSLLQNYMEAKKGA